MYDEWLKTCSEKELFAFYEAQYVPFIYDDSVTEEWLNKTKENLYKAREMSSRFYSDECPSFATWYEFWRLWCMQECTKREWISLLSRMPWNVEDKNEAV